MAAEAPEGLRCARTAVCIILLEPTKLRASIMATRISALIFLLLFIAACQSKDSERQFKELTQDLQRAADQTMQKLGKLASDPGQISDLTSDEIEKLFVFEYTVVDLPAAATSREMEVKLTQLGADRWECFHIERSGDVIRFFCKRRPKTYLRYIPRLF